MERVKNALNGAEKNDYKIDGKEARIAKILIDENGSCLEDLEYIDDLDGENE